MVKKENIVAVRVDNFQQHTLYVNMYISIIYLQINKFQVCNLSRVYRKPHHIKINELMNLLMYDDQKHKKQRKKRCSFMLVHLEGGGRGRSRRYWSGPEWWGFYD